MTRETVMADLTTVFRQVFGSDDLQLSETMTAADVPGWDSLRMVAILVAVEEKFRIRLRSRDVDRLASVGDLIDLLSVKLAVA